MKKFLLCLVFAVTLGACAAADAQSPMPSPMETAVLTWQAPVPTPPGVITYTVYQGRKGAPKIAVSGGQTTALTYTVLVAPTNGQEICWQVTAKLTGPESDFSNEACKVFSWLEPPTNLRVLD